MNKRNRVFPSAKSKILATSRIIISKDGMESLTVDRIISVAELSKAGFFYHYKTIDDMLSALVLSLFDEIKAQIEKIAIKDPKEKGKYIRAYIKHSLSEDNDEFITLFRSLVEIFSKNNLSSKSNELRDYYLKSLKSLMDEDLDQIVVMTILNSLDGIWYNRIFNTVAFSKKDLKKFSDHLISLTY